MKTQRLRFPALALVLALVAGCATAPPERMTPEATGPAWEAHREAVAALRHWRLDGRVGIREAGEGGSLGLSWVQEGTAYRMDFRPPVGGGGLRLVGGERGVLLMDDAGNRRFARDVDALLERQLGWSVPVDRLRFWVRGLPAAGEAVALGPRARLRELEDGPWRVSYQAYRPVDGIHLPVKLRVENPDRELVLKLVVDRWRLLEPAEGADASL